MFLMEGAERSACLREGFEAAVVLAGKLFVDGVEDKELDFGWEGIETCEILESVE